MQTLSISNAELAAYVKAYNRESDYQGTAPFGAYIGEVQTVTCPIEALDLLRSTPNAELTREQICFKSGDDALAHFIYTGVGELKVYFVTSEAARKVIPLLREDGGGISEMGIIEHWAI